MNRIAYLLSEYPAISHTFIFREIQDLKRLGFEIHSVSVNQPKPWQGMTSQEQDAINNTSVLKSRMLPRMIVALAYCLVKNPMGLLKMWLFSLKLWVRGPRSPLKGFAYFVEAVLLIRILDQKGLSHIHEHFANPTAFICLMLKHFGGFTYSLSVHGPDIFRKVDSAMLKEKFENATFIRSISHFCHSQICQILPQELWGRVHMVRCGVDPDHYKPKPYRKNESAHLLCVGRLSSAKGQRVLLDACVRLKTQEIPFRLTFVGDGPDRDGLEKATRTLELEHEVDFAGAIGQKELQAFYDQADLFVLPSFAEGIPVVLMEAMSKKIPVISTQINGIPELIHDRVNGMLVYPSDSKGLANTICYLLTHAQLRQGLADQGRLTVQKFYNHHKNNEELGRVFSAYGCAA